MNLSKDGLVKNSENDWVAWILEIRAANEHRVYARVYWMYSPDELPTGTICGKKRIQGRQPYHGRNELIASNHSKSSPPATPRSTSPDSQQPVDIINVVSIIEPATVGQWIESDDDETMDELYWRQTFNYLDSQLSVRGPKYFSCSR